MTTKIIRIALVLAIALSLASCSWLADKITGSASKGLSVKANIAKDIHDENSTLKVEAENMKTQLQLMRVQQETTMQAQRDIVDNSKHARTWYLLLLDYLFYFSFASMGLFAFIYVFKLALDKK